MNLSRLRGLTVEVRDAVDAGSSGMDPFGAPATHRVPRYHGTGHWLECVTISRDLRVESGADAPVLRSIGDGD